MKLLGFSPWQQIKTSIYVSSSNNDVEFPTKNRIAYTEDYEQPPLNKRVRFSSDNKQNVIADIEPVIILTGSHQIIITGHSRKQVQTPKLLTAMEGTPHTNNNLNESTEWMYYSRPDNVGSFLPDCSQNVDCDYVKCVNIAAVVDLSSRRIFALQNSNRSLSVWSLDSDVHGPDDINDSNCQNSYIHKIQFQYPAICMEPFSHKRCKQNEDGHRQDEVHCGVAGLLANGQMFLVVLISSTSATNELGKQRIFAGTFSPENGLNEPLVNLLNDDFWRALVFSGVGYNPEEKIKTIKGTQSSPVAEKKRKNMSDCDSRVCSDIGLGEVTLTALFLNKKSRSIVMCKYLVLMSSLVFEIQQNNVECNVTQPKNIKEMHSVQFNLDFFEETENNDGMNYFHEVKATQIDLNHVALVYSMKTCPSVKCEWYCVVLNIRVGEFVIKPFSLSSSLSANVIDIGGLNNSILAILTLDWIVYVYDVKRRIMVHSVNVCEVSMEMIRTRESGKGVSISLSTHWYSGTIGLVCKCYDGTKGFITVQMAHIGLFEENAPSSDHTSVITKPKFDGSFNLASIIQSKFAASRMTKITNITHTNKTPVVRNLCQIFLKNKCEKEGILTEERRQMNISRVMQFLQSYHKRKDKESDKEQKSFSFEIFKLCKIISSNMDIINDDSKKQKPLLKNSCKSHQDNTKLEDSLPQCVIDVVVLFCIEMIISFDVKVREKYDALDVLIACIKSGKVSARLHFEKVKSPIIQGGNNVLRMVLTALNKVTNQIGGSAINSNCGEENYSNSQSLCLIYHLLRYCHDSLPENMLVTLVHHVICHTTPSELKHLWLTLARHNPWFHDTEIIMLQRRLAKQLSFVSISQSGSGGNEITDTSSLKDGTDNMLCLEKDRTILHSLENQISVTRQLFLVGKIVNYSKCNGAMLRTSLKNGLNYSEKGEVEVLLQMLCKLLHRVGRNDQNRYCDSTSEKKSRALRIIQWISAVTDSHMRRLLVASLSCMTIDAWTQLKNCISVAVSQSEALLGLNDLLDHFVNIDDVSRNRVVKEINDPLVPQYGIESLIF